MHVLKRLVKHTQLYNQREAKEAWEKGEEAQPEYYKYVSRSVRPGYVGEILKFQNRYALT